MASAQNLHTKQQKNHTGHGESITASWAGPNDLRAIADKDMKLFNDFLADRHWLEGLFTTNIESIATRVDCFTQRLHPPGEQAQHLRRSPSKLHPYIRSAAVLPDHQCPVFGS